jgi:hypothetical protein
MEPEYWSDPEDSLMVMKNEHSIFSWLEKNVVGPFGVVHEFINNFLHLIEDLLVGGSLDLAGINVDLAVQLLSV